MTLSWNEIKERALKFSKEWTDTSSEEADAKPFLDAFFDVFGISRKKIGTFEHRVKKLSETDGYIDLLWKGTILVEMKSRGKNLDKAFEQAKEYTYGLKQHDLPKYILVSDFEIFRLTDLEEDKTYEFRLSELVNNVQHFGYLLGYQKKEYKEQNPANIKAAELMGKLHDRLREIGYTGHPLEVYLVRILFVLFAEDTTIFEKQQFQDFIERHTNEDGSDLAAKLQELFQVLNTPQENRFKNLDEDLNAFPYINGKLFEEILPTASFDSKMRQALLNCTYLDWSEISPAIFGSMFQSVMNPIERKNLGAHYTSETNILKLIKPLFLDELWREFESVKENRNKLSEFHKQLSTFRFLDPACGCGNFLVIAYRELRLLELEILRTLFKGRRVFDITDILWLDVDQFYGIELEEFPARIAEVAMWIIDHQMNMIVSHEFGQYFVRLPLKKAATIVHGDALKTNWQSLLNPLNTYTVHAEHADIFLLQEPEIPYGKVNVETKSYSIHTGTPETENKTKFDYIIGNPPFIGSRLMSKEQKEGLQKVFGNIKNVGELDYITGWYIKAAQYIQNTKTKVAFVGTNSIVQGEQTAILWGQMLNRYGIKIHFAHRNFKWGNEAKGNAAVHVVIIGFANFDTNEKRIFEYEDIRGEAHEIKAKNISPYLVDAKDILIVKRRKPICNVHEISFGNMPNDGGNFLFTDEEKNDFVKQEPKAEKWIKPFKGAYEFLNGIKRWCLWLKNANPTEIREAKAVIVRIENVRKIRSKSSREATKKLAAFPTLFGEIRQPENDYILIPRVSSERRNYIPMGFFDKDSIVSDSCLAISNATLYHFGILMSKMHMAWVQTVCGRLEISYRYSNEIVYNNFPWAENPTEKQIQAIEKAAQKVLDVREQFSGSSLANLYNPSAMPPELTKAHNELDKAVDLAYRSQSFTSEANRMEFLFELYEKYTANLFTKVKPKKTKNNKE
ncbi:MAG: class I SAM-dependent DNA methyltransferase [Lentimicrobiaceae bacterium]|nr:class I SAM-dependent DNA methyltransferase [Lentimicrobiaceae bacterium]